MRYRPLLLTALFIAAMIPIGKFCLQKTQYFMTIEIESDRPFNPAFETRSLSASELDEIQQALSQKYIYHTFGGQAFVFFSQDGNYVLKFFKQRHFREPTYLNYLPLSDTYRKAKFAKRHKWLMRDYGSYKIGFNELQQETALVYLHLNKTDLFKRNVILIDKLNIEHPIPLDTTDFILQRRARSVHSTIAAQMKAGDLQGAQKTITAVVDLIVHRCKLGYRDEDPSIKINCGILEGKAIKMDVGRFSHDPLMKLPLFYKPELLYLTRPFQKWLSTHYPELVPHLEAEVQKVILHG